MRSWSERVQFSSDITPGKDMQQLWSITGNSAKIHIIFQNCNQALLVFLQCYFK